MIFFEVIMMFYEFGYVVYGLFFDVKYLSLVGIVIVCDFVEFFL